MKHFLFIFPCLLILQSCSGLIKTSVPSCPELNKHNFCYATLAQIAPTQMNIGLLAIEHRASKILKESRQNELKSYLDKRKAPAIKGPNGRYYILDRHHLAASLYYSPISYQQKRVLIHLEDDRSEMGHSDFLNWMNEKGYLYLKDNGKEKRPEDLPSEISQLTNDSYRGLIWLAIRTNYVEKPQNALAYFEFNLAEKVRNKIDLSQVRPRVRKDYLPFLEKVSEILAP